MRVEGTLNRGLGRLLGILVALDCGLHLRDGPLLLGRRLLRRSLASRLRRGIALGRVVGPTELPVGALREHLDLAVADGLLVRPGPRGIGCAETDRSHVLRVAQVERLVTDRLANLLRTRQRRHPGDLRPPRSLGGLRPHVLLLLLLGSSTSRCYLHFRCSGGRGASFGQRLRGTGRHHKSTPLSLHDTIFNQGLLKSASRIYISGKLQKLTPGTRLLKEPLSMPPQRFLSASEGTVETLAISWNLLRPLFLPLWPFPRHISSSLLSHHILPPAAQGNDR